MKNVLDILESLGVELNEEQKTTLDKEVASNYKTVAEFDKKIKKLEDERSNLQTQIDSANKALEGFKGVNVEEINNKVAEYQKKLEEMEAGYKTRLAEREYADALADALADVKFSSNSAKRAVMEDIKKANLPMVNGKIVGLRDYLDALKESDADAFVSDQKQPARFTAPADKTPEKPRLTKEEILKIADTRDRQKAIAENIDLFIHK